MMTSPIRTAIGAILFAGSLQTANASSVDAATLLRNYNLIISGDASISSHVDGKTLIGGNLTGGGDFNIHSVSSPAPALTVGGNVTGANFNVNGSGLHVGGAISSSVNMNGGGNAYVGSVAAGGLLQNNANGTGSTFVVGNIAGTVNTNGGSTIYGGSLTGTANGAIQQPVTRPFAPETVASDAIASLAAFSSQLGTIVANSSYSISASNVVTFNASGTGLASFDISDADSFFNSAAEFQFNLNGAQRMLINVRSAGSPLNLHANFLNGAAPNLGSKILWNFVDASSLTVDAQFGGSILALFADATVNQNIEGTLVAKSLIQGAEIHSQPLEPGFAAPVPLPAAAPLFGSALAGIGAFARRNRKLHV